MKKVQPAVDAIDARIKSLKKVVADLKARHERLLSGATVSSHFEDQTLISGLWLDFYPLCSFIPFPHVYFFPLFLYTAHFISLALILISLIWFIYFGFVIYYSTSTTTTIMLYDTVYFANTSWSSLLSALDFNHELQAKHATVLSCDIIFCKGGHLEGEKKKKKKKKKEMNDYIIFQMHNSVSATCH